MGNRAFTVVHVDGSSIGNPGPSGAGAIIRYPDGREERCVAYLGRQTCNQAELMAAVKALEFIPEHSRVTLFSDSQYVVRGFQGTYQIKTNPDIWRRLRAAACRHDVVIFGWIPRDMNMEADKLAGRGARRKSKAVRG